VPISGGTKAATPAEMTEKADLLKQRTKKFALDILAFSGTLPGDDQARDIGRQLTRAATGVGANYRAACRARSRAEFAAKVGVVLEEADESAFWLEVVAEGGVVKGQRVYELLDEANQLCAIFVASSKTAREPLNR
jgi:four helix bundle protein